jgi:hypothetical protein
MLKSVTLFDPIVLACNAVPSRLKPPYVSLSMIHHRHFFGRRLFPLQHSRCLLHLSVAGTRTAQARLLGPMPLSAGCLICLVCRPRPADRGVELTSMSTKLGVGSSSSDHHPVVIAPVALPGFTKNLPSISYASNLCVPPQSRTSTSICLAAISKLSPSPGGMMVCPCVKPIRSDPCVTTFDKARFGASTSKSPFTICRSGAMARRNS